MATFYENLKNILLSHFNWKAGGFKLIRKMDVTEIVGRLRKAWKEFPQCEIETIIGQFRKRCNKVREVKGKHIEQFF